VPQSGLPLEVQDADHVLPFGVITRHCDHSTVRQHSSTSYSHTHH
jgi:hypothetical protein